MSDQKPAPVEEKMTEEPTETNHIEGDASKTSTKDSLAGGDCPTTEKGDCCKTDGHNHPEKQAV